MSEFKVNPSQLSDSFDVCERLEAILAEIRFLRQDMIDLEKTIQTVITKPAIAVPQTVSIPKHVGRPKKGVGLLAAIPATDDAKWDVA